MPKYRRSFSIIGVYIGKSVSPLKYPFKVYNDITLLLSFIWFRSFHYLSVHRTHACIKQARENRVRLSIAVHTHVSRVSLRRHSVSWAIWVRFPALGYQFPTSPRYKSAAVVYRAAAMRYDPIARSCQLKFLQHVIHVQVKSNHVIHISHSAW